jgi:hypothetical protein
MENVYRLENKEEFWEKHQETGQLVMMLQEEIVLLNISECIVLAVKVRIMQYEPRNAPHLRYVIDGPPVDKNYSP